MGPLPVLQLVLAILHFGHWPDLWITHGIVAIFKEREHFLPGNYRGADITSQLGKVMERLLGRSWVGRMTTDAYIGRTQFA